VTVIYLAVNASLLAGLGVAKLQRYSAAASTLALYAFGQPGLWIMALLVMISALGATNGAILTGGHFFAAFGAQHPGFGWLSAAQTRRGAPLVALIAQAALSLFMVALVETGDVWKPWCRSLGFALAEAPASDGFSALVDCTAPVFWTFFLLTGIALVVLRVREPERPRPFRVPLFPLVALTFCGVCAFMLYSSVNYAIGQRPVEALVVLTLLALGIPVYILTRGAAPPVATGGLAPANEPTP
jgi:amino acid transporter